MQIYLRHILSVCLFILSTCYVSAQTEELDSLRASLITCTPGVDAYAHFGHTALRVTNFTNGKDIIFNYGCFDSSQSNFILRFIKGETDYVVNAEESEYFFWRYNQLGNGVSEQELNLTQEECHRLAELLVINVMPENCGYRYNWLYDNCTTRARDMIEKALEAKVEYNNCVPTLSARNELYECLHNDSWLKLGIDLLLGNEIDTIAPRKVQQFIPAHYENDLDNAYVIDTNGNKRKLVSDKKILLEEKDFNKTTDFPITPVVLFSLVLIITIAITIYDLRKGRLSIWYDIILHISQGLAGIIIAYLFFFSLHPAVDSNCQVWLFNPFALIYAGWICYSYIKKIPNILSYVNLALIIAFLFNVIVTKQHINPAVYLMASVLFIRAIANLPHLSFKGKNN